jgi:hypothetical protein
MLDQPIDPSSPSAVPRASRWLGGFSPRSFANRVAAAAFLCIAFGFAATALCAIANFAWRQPMFDQYRSYVAWLTLPFPQNILQQDNGHRPIIPNLIRLVEIHWLASNQLLQISIGTLCAVLTSGIVAFSAWRDRELPLIARAAGVMLAVLGVFWLANARMQMHGNESLHAYMVTLSVVCAGLFTWRAAQNQALRWFGAASAACVVATFCFGPGIATFVMVIVLGMMLRLPWRWLLLPIGVMAACLLVYLFVLPGGQGVRGMLAFHPLDSADVAAQWLSSPWINGWLGMAEPAVEPMLLPGLRETMIGPAIVASANGVVSFTGLAWHSLGSMLGFCGGIVFLVRLAIAYQRHTVLTRLQALSIALCLFALASAAIIGVGRVESLRANPSQIYADRYLMWPSLFWMGLALLLLIDVSKSKNRLLIGAGLVFLFSLPAVMFPTHRGWSGWSAAVYQSAQQTAAAARSGVFDADLLPEDDAASRASRIQTLGLMRQQRLAMFADPAWELVGSHLSGSVERSDEYAVQTRIVGPVTDVVDAKIALHFEGWIGRGIAKLQKHGQLVVLDDAGTVVGLAEYSFIKPGAVTLRLNLPRKRGFDGYIKNYHADRAYTLVSLDVESGRATALAPLHTAGISETGVVGPAN